MSKNSVSEWSTVSSGNGDIAGLTLGLDMPPSYVNNAMQEMMAQIKQWKDGYTDPITGLPVYQSLTVQNINVKGILNVTGSLTMDGAQGNLGQVLTSRGSSSTPTWGNAFVTGMIMLWSGAYVNIPSGWRLCNGTLGTPNLADKFIIGAGINYSLGNTGGSADSTLVAHSHSISSVSGNAGTHSHLLSGSTSGAGSHNHTIPNYLVSAVAGSGDIDRDNEYQQWKATPGQVTNTVGNHTHSLSGSTTLSGNHNHPITSTCSGSGSSSTNRNLPPYYALAYIIKL